MIREKQNFRNLSSSTSNLISILRYSLVCTGMMRRRFQPFIVKRLHNDPALMHLMESFQIEFKFSSEDIVTLRSVVNRKSVAIFLPMLRNSKTKSAKLERAALDVACDQSDIGERKTINTERLRSVGYSYLTTRR